MQDAATGKWYQFSHWSLGDGTTVRTSLNAGDGDTYVSLQVDPGTIGDLTFVANWVEAAPVGPADQDNPGNPADSETPTDPDDPDASAEPVDPASLTQTGDSANFAPWFVLALLSAGVIGAVLFVRKRRA